MKIFPIRNLVFAFLLTAIFLPGAQLQAQDMLEQGDILSEYIKTAAESETGQPLIITSPKKTPFAIVQGEPPNSRYLIDTTDDRILNITRNRPCQLSKSTQATRVAFTKLRLQRDGIL